jgi:hypothetical protein
VHSITFTYVVDAPDVASAFMQGSPIGQVGPRNASWVLWNVIFYHFTLSPFIEACHGLHVVLYAPFSKVVAVAYHCDGRGVDMHRSRRKSCNLDSHYMKRIRIC